MPGKAKVRRRRPRGIPYLYESPKGSWILRHGRYFRRLGQRSYSECQAILQAYIASKYQPAPSPTPLIADVLHHYVKTEVPSRRTARPITYHIASLVDFFGEKFTSAISPQSCREYAAGRPQQSARAALKYLRAALNSYHKSELGPLAVIPAMWMPPAGKARERFLSRSELARLLWAARRTPIIRRFIVLAYYTGSRPGNVLSARWDMVDFDSQIWTRSRDGGTANKRAPKVKLGRKILGHLRRWKRMDGVRIEYICHTLDGRRVVDPSKSWRRVVAAAGLQGQGVSRHTIRHTTATHLLSLKNREGKPALSLWEVSGFLGMSVKILESTYGHFIPDASVPDSL